MSAYRTFNMQRDKDKHKSTTRLLSTIRFGTGDHTCPITPLFHNKTPFFLRCRYFGSINIAHLKKWFNKKYITIN